MSKPKPIFHPQPKTEHQLAETATYCAHAFTRFGPEFVCGGNGAILLPDRWRCYTALAWSGAPRTVCTPSGQDVKEDELLSDLKLIETAHGLKNERLSLEDEEHMMWFGKSMLEQGISATNPCLGILAVRGRRIDSLVAAMPATSIGYIAQQMRGSGLGPVELERLGLHLAFNYVVEGLAD